MLLVSLSCLGKPLTNVQNVACRGKTSKPLEGLVGSECRPESNSNPERGLHSPISDPTELVKVTHRHKLLCQSSQEPLLVRGIASAYGQKCRRIGPKPKICGILQPAFLGTKAEQQMETYTRSKQSEPIPQGVKFKMETPETIRTSNKGSGLSQ